MAGRPLGAAAVSNTSIHTQHRLSHLMPQWAVERQCGQTGGLKKSQAKRKDVGLGQIGVVLTIIIESECIHRAEHQTWFMISNGR